MWEIVVKLRVLLNLNIVATAIGQFRSQSLHLFVHRSTSLFVARTAKVEVFARADIGRQFEGARPLPGFLAVREGGRLILEGHVDIISPCAVTVHPNAELLIGDAFLNAGLRISCYEHICIGDGCLIAEDVHIRDSDNHRVIGGREPTAAVHVGKGVWIGTGATILKGVSIGDGAIVSAGALVTKDVPARSLVAGVPAEVKRQDVSWEP